MHSLSFQDTGLKLHRYVNDSTGQVAERLTILPYPRGIGNKGLTPRKRQINLHSHSFQDTELKLNRYVNDSTGKVAESLMIIPYTPVESGIKG